MPSRNEGSRIFLGNLPFDVRERDIEKFFDRYGRVRNIFIKNGKYGFCEFDDYRDADDAVYEMNGKEMLGERITVEHARGPRRNREPRGYGGRNRANWVEKYGPPTRTDNRLIVENLSSRVSWQDLKDLMRRAGEVTYANAHRDKRNEGVVEFASRRDLERAIDKYDDYELEGRRIKLIKEKRRRSRTRSRSRSTSRSRSRSNSRSPSRSKSRSRSRSRSRSGDRDDKRSRRRSRSGSKSRSRSTSRSPRRNNDESREEEKSSRKRSRSRSGSRSGDETEEKKFKKDDNEEIQGEENETVKEEMETEAAADNEEANAEAAPTETTEENAPEYPETAKEEEEEPQEKNDEEVGPPEGEEEERPEENGVTEPAEAE